MKLNEPLSCISKSSFWGWLKMLSYSKLFHLILPITRAGRIQVIGNAALYTIAGNILNYLSYEINHQRIYLNLSPTTLTNQMTSRCHFISASKKKENVHFNDSWRNEKMQMALNYMKKNSSLHSQYKRHVNEHYTETSRF